MDRARPIPGERLTELRTAVAATQPRARGEIRARFDRSGSTARLIGLRQAGSSRALFPRTDGDTPQMVLTNTSGGVTGGDRFRTEIAAEDGAAVTVTTQTAERAYRAQPGQVGRVDTVLRIGAGSRINWVPQETILFDGCAFARRLTVELGEGSSALVVEPVVFGRSAMGESVTSALFDDRIEIRCGGDMVFLDRTRLDGDIAASLAKPGVANGAVAGAILLFAGASAEAQLARVRDLLPETAGASLVRPNLLVCRLVSEDSYTLRKVMMPLIAMLLDDVIPRPWMI